MPIKRDFVYLLGRYVRGLPLLVYCQLPTEMSVSRKRDGHEHNDHSEDYEHKHDD
jgi:hypothetical protein